MGLPSISAGPGGGGGAGRSCLAKVFTAESSLVRWEVVGCLGGGGGGGLDDFPR